MSAVSSYNDFSRLEEIIIGNANGAHLPTPELSLTHFFEPPPEHRYERVRADRMQRVIEETEQDLESFANTLKSFGVAVRRPDPVSHGKRIDLPGWAAKTMFSLMPRDCLLVIGTTIIEAAMPARPRYCEIFPFRRLLREYFEGGTQWIAAPRPQLPDTTYRFRPEGPELSENEPLFDAANIIRCGTDIFFNVSNTGNRLAARWLQQVLGSHFRVHEMSICPDHVGTTLHILKPGVLLANPERLGRESIPLPLRSWKTLWFDKPVDDGYGFDWPRASVWIGMNIISIDEETIVVSESQTWLIRMLEKEGFTVVPQRYRHGRTFGGGFHCCSLDTRRVGELESYL